MKIKSMPLDFEQAGDLYTIISEIVVLADPEKILLLAAGYNYQFKEDIFIKNPVQKFGEAHYELLVLIQSPEKILLAEQKLRITKKLHLFRNLQLHLRDIQEFYKRVEAGDEFENYILLNAMVCYDRG